MANDCPRDEVNHNVPLEEEIKGPIVSLSVPDTEINEEDYPKTINLDNCNELTQNNETEEQPFANGSIQVIRC